MIGITAIQFGSWHAGLRWKRALRFKLLKWAAITHDIADGSFMMVMSPWDRGKPGVMEAECLAPEVVDQVTRIIATISFKGAACGQRPSLNTCVEDADRLDAMGSNVLPVFRLWRTRGASTCT